MEAHVHMTGYVGSDVEFRNNNTPVASFRLACTPRIRKLGEWTDGDTTWLTVTCWRNLAENVASSVNRGDPVAVIGKLRTSNFTRTDGTVLTRMTLDAYSVGHDLTRGTSAFRKNERPVPDESDRESDVHSMAAVVESQTAEEEAKLAAAKAA